MNGISAEMLRGLGKPGRYDLKGEIIGHVEGLNEGTHLDLFVITEDRFRISALGLARIAEADTAHSEQEIKGYSIKIEILNDDVYVGMFENNKRTEVIGLCERLAIDLRQKNIDEALKQLKNLGVQMIILGSSFTVST